LGGKPAADLLRVKSIKFSMAIATEINETFADKKQKLTTRL
jgi:hypothetical protein